MQLVLHTGAHFTEEDRLMKCLLRNKEDFSRRGIAVPGPGKYRKLLRETLFAMRDAAPGEGAREVLLDAILDDETADRLILSNAHFFGAPRAALRNGLLYPSAPERLIHMCQLFAQEEIELFMALRNPATFLPACFGESPREGIEDFMDGVDPREVRWSDLVLRMRDAAPQIQLTVWCNEDMPMIWAQIIREIAGLGHGDSIEGSFDLLSEIMSPEGMKRFHTYMKQHPGLPELQTRRVIAAFLDKFAIDDEIEEELDMPGWTNALVDELTQIYEEDVFAIQRLPGVQLISP